LADTAADDRRFMRRALALAARGRATSSPNPHVGAVVVRGGRVVGEGFHRRAGEAHAEPQALASAGAGARGATLYVNLEPCAHHGRTPPCVDAILAAGPRRVVIAHLDPDPRTAGRSVERLRRAGIDVTVGVEAAAALELNAWFVIERIDKRPAVTWKCAASLDGKIATRDGESRWITGPEARRSGLSLRDEHDAILVGSETVLVDDPRLDRRVHRGAPPILRVVMDRRLRVSPRAQLFDVPGPVLVFTESTAPRRTRALAARGAEVVCLARVTPQTVLRALHRRGVASVLLEGGGTLAAAFAAAGRIDRVIHFTAPLLIGGAGAPGALAGEGVARLARALRLRFTDVRRVGGDLRIEAFPAGRFERWMTALVERAEAR
jgi:diaminohydroxyphosphoribosylaminopyrimidine deaminase / 5-amino-6-(5-phosphoribosylamino)uracil reductase